ncbi:uncharacterized protein LOC113498833 [Trichoplusia ni]|uniref:Uncharacterized protein LOC113498833 n=1 Tax=Trichoplusia ni TaxID=7111 RepID=A0A7E5W2P8_TRINI|nr:uncharacterized protein LOC113498833 [Trichoplusia ni]
MSTVWKCDFQRIYTAGTNDTVKSKNGKKYCAHFIVFQIHVKGAKKASFTVNNWNLETQTSEQLSTKYDGEIDYQYSDGGLIFLRANSSTGSNRLKYYDDKGTLLFQTDEMNSTIKFRSVLTARNNYFYVECEHYSTEPPDTYYYRIKLVLKNPEEEDEEIKVLVNGLTLAPKITYSKNTRTYNYFYEYGFENNLDVIYENNKNVKGSIGLKVDKNILLADTSSVSNTSEQYSVMKKQMSTDKLNGKTVLCRYVHDNNNIVLVSLLFQNGLFGNSGARILGLPEKNIQYEYTKSSRNYSMTYSYTLNEIVNLSCISNWSIATIEKIVWRDINNNTTMIPNESYGTVVASLSFKLTAEYNNTYIRCEVRNHHSIVTNIVDVFLQLKPINEVLSLITDESQPLIIVGGSIAAMFAIVIAIIALYWWARSRKISNEDNYENFSNDSISPAYGSQWENHYEDPSKVNQTIRHSEVPTETHYTEIDYFFINREGTTLRDHYDHLDRNSSNPSNSTSEVIFRNNCREERNYSISNCNIGFKNNSIYTTDQQTDNNVHCLNVNNHGYSNTKSC